MQGFEPSARFTAARATSRSGGHSGIRLFCLCFGKLKPGRPLAQISRRAVIRSGHRKERFTTRMLPFLVFFLTQIHYTTGTVCHSMSSLNFLMHFHEFCEFVSNYIPFFLPPAPTSFHVCTATSAANFPTHLPFLRSLR